MTGTLNKGQSLKGLKGRKGLGLGERGMVKVRRKGYGYGQEKGVWLGLGEKDMVTVRRKGYGYGQG